MDTPQGRAARRTSRADLSNVAAVARGIGRALSEARRERPPWWSTRARCRSQVATTSRCWSETGPKRPKKWLRLKINQTDATTSPPLLRERPTFCHLQSGVSAGGERGPRLFIPGTDRARGGFPRGAGHLKVPYEPIIEQSFPTRLDPRPKGTVLFVATDLASAEKSARLLASLV